MPAVKKRVPRQVRCIAAHLRLEAENDGRNVIANSALLLDGHEALLPSLCAWYRSLQLAQCDVMCVRPC